MAAQTRVMLIGSPLTGSLKAGITNTKVPLGLAYLGAVLEEADFSVRILDCLADYHIVQRVSDDTYRVGTSAIGIEQELKVFRPDVVGINCSYSMYEQDSFDVARIVKKIFPETLVVFGGAHSSASPESVLANKDVDVIVHGEAEYTFREIVQTFAKNKKKSALNKIEGTILLDAKGKVKKNEERPFIWSLDELPMPARHLLPMEKYLKHPLNDVGIGKGPATDMITSRGCPQKCSFCSIFTVWKRVWRTRSAKLVVDEMEHLVKEYGVKHIRIQDDNFSLDTKRVADICDDIVARGLDFKWDTPNGIAIWTLDEPLLKKMAKSGYHRASFGIETGCKKTMDQYIHKPIDYDHCKKIITACKKLGIFTVSTFLIGFPDETKEDIQETIDFANDSGLDFSLFYVAQPYAGTPLYDKFKKEGLLRGNQQSNLINPTYDTHHFTGEELQKMQVKAQKNFIRRKIRSMTNPFYSLPWLFYHLRDTNNLHFITKMAKNFLSFKHISFFNKSHIEEYAYDMPDKEQPEQEELTVIQPAKEKNNSEEKISLNVLK